MDGKKAEAELGDTVGYNVERSNHDAKLPLLWDSFLIIIEVFKCAAISALNKGICIGCETAYYRHTMALSYTSSCLFTQINGN